MLEEREVVKIDNILDDGRASIRKGIQVVRVNDDGSEEIISEGNYSRHVLDVGDDITNEPQIVKDFAAGVHTPERKAARDAIKAEIKAKEEAEKLAAEEAKDKEPEVV